VQRKDPFAVRAQTPRPSLGIALGTRMAQTGSDRAWSRKALLGDTDVRDKPCLRQPSGTKGKRGRVSWLSVVFSEVPERDGLPGRKTVPLDTRIQRRSCQKTPMKALPRDGAKVGSPPLSPFLMRRLGARVGGEAFAQLPPMWRIAPGGVW
jgi:hypothetical protein